MKSCRRRSRTADFHTAAFNGDNTQMSSVCIAETTNRTTHFCQFSAVQRQSRATSLKRYLCVPSPQPLQTENGLPRIGNSRASPGKPFRRLHDACQPAHEIKRTAHRGRIVRRCGKLSGERVHLLHELRTSAHSLQPAEHQMMQSSEPAVIFQPPGRPERQQSLTRTAPAVFRRRMPETGIARCHGRNRIRCPERRRIPDPAFENAVEQRLVHHMLSQYPDSRIAEIPYEIPLSITVIKKLRFRIKTIFKKSLAHEFRPFEPVVVFPRIPRTDAILAIAIRPPNMVAVKSGAT